MSEPTADYLLAKAQLCVNTAISQLMREELDEAIKNIERANSALYRVLGIERDEESKMKEWLLDLQENGDDGTGFNDYKEGE